MASKLKLPPKDIPPERLFRLLARAGRATVDIDHRVRGAEAVRLAVRALTWGEEMAVVDAALSVGEEDAAKGVMAAGYVVAALLADGQLAFQRPSDIGKLAEHEVYALCDAVLGALAVVSPSRVRSDIVAWKAALDAGAAHPSNQGTAGEMHDCSDWVIGSKVVAIPRPERYYGVPPVALTEGQKMVFHAACRVVEMKSGRK